MAFEKAACQQPKKGAKSVADEENQLLRRQERIDVVFENIFYRVPVDRHQKTYKFLLKGVSCSFNSAKLTGILGPSGAGKTTLTNVLAGYKVRNVSGTIKVNGENRNLRTFRKRSGYIMANEELLPHLTVTESMMVSANLKLPERTSSCDKLKIVNNILDKLGLTDCTSTKVGQLSSGQRKRLSIAQELVNNPPLMFFDEPTSGLDSQASFQCISLLKSLAMDGRTVVCTIHQPSAKLFAMFDQIYVMADGAFIYSGKVPTLLPYLKSQGFECPPYHNPADFVIEIAAGEYGDVVERLVHCLRSGCETIAVAAVNQTDANDRRQQITPCRQNGSPGAEIADGRVICSFDVERKSVSIPIAAVAVVNRCKEWLLGTPYQRSTEDRLPFATRPATQFSVLFVRTFKCTLRDTYLTQLRLLAHIIVGLLIGVLYYGTGDNAMKTHDNTSCLYFSLLFLVFTAMMSTIVTFPLEMNVFVREHLNCWYSIKAYFFAKSTADMPFQVAFPMIYSTIVYYMTNQPRELMRFNLYLLMSVLTSLTAQSLGLLIGAAASLQVAVFVGPAVTIPFLLFSGFFVSIHTIPALLRWLSYLSYFRYAYEGMLLSIYGLDRKPMKCTNELHFLCMLGDPQVLLEVLNIKEGKVWVDVLMLIVFFLFFRICCFFVLRWRVSKQK